MAKTYRDLWPRVVCWENLLASYRACRRRKRYSPRAVQFDYEWESNLLRLQEQLEAGTYACGAYRNFYIHDPKRRRISAAPFRDRVLHHAVVRVLEPIFERRFIYDSYACRRGKGTHRALDRAQYYLRRHGYCLKTDIVRFFPNVDHQVLLDLLARYIRDEKLMALIRLIVASGEGVLADEATETYFPRDDLFAVLRPKGLPIGNLTSQFFANVLLDSADHFIKEDLHVPGHVRYADDLLLFADSKAQLWDYRAAIVKRLALLRLNLHEGKTHIRPCSAGVKFLGLVLRRDGRRLQQRTLRRFSGRLRRFRRLFAYSMATPREISRSLRAWLAFAEGANSRGIRNALSRR
ncbi:MAG: reverse transcriptase domain-containing protein, partial [Pirellulales bacterium]